VICLAGAGLAIDSFDLAGTEEGGGSVTGPLIMLQEIGCLLLFAALILTILAPKIAAIGGLTGAFSCLPYYLYSVAPGLYRWFIPEGWSVALTSYFYRNDQAGAGILTVLVTAFICIRTLSRSGAKRGRPEGAQS
jgi:hypothetical protein